MRYLCFGLLVLAACAGCRQETPTGLTRPVADAEARPVAVWGCVYEADAGVLWVSTAPGSVPVKLLTMQPDEYVNECAVSPDGRQVALTTDQDQGKVVRLADGAVQPLFTEATDAAGLAWSPDGSQVAYGLNGALYVQQPGQARVLLVEAPRISDLAWSPDGSQLAYGRRAEDDADLGLWIIAAAGGEPRQLVEPSGDVFGVADISFSPDGGTIAFLHAWEGGALCFVNPDGSGYRKDLGPAWGDLQWLGDSSAVVYVAMDDEITTKGVFRCSPAGEPEGVIGGASVSFDLRPAGDLLVVRNPVDEMAEKLIEVLVVAGASPGAQATWSRKVTGHYGTGSWEPEGEALALCVEDEVGKGTLYMAPLAGELSQRVTAMRRILGWARREAPAGAQ